MIYNDFQILNEKAMKDTDLLNARLTKVQQDFEQQLMNCDQLASENTQKAAELKAREDEINGLKQDTVRLTKMREAIQRKLRAVEDQKLEVEQQKETLKSQIAGLEKGKNDHHQCYCIMVGVKKTCLGLGYSIVQIHSKIFPTPVTTFC